MFSTNSSLRLRRATFGRLTAAGACLALVGAACGPDATANENTTAPVAEPASIDAPVPDADAEPAAIEPDSAASTPAPEPELAPQPTPDAEPEPAPSSTSEPAAAPCGIYDPLPPRPDSMPTTLGDTDEDGELDDEITAYGATDAWRLRVVENGVISEAAMPAIGGWAYLAGIGDFGDGMTIDVIDADTDDRYEFGFDDSRCLVQVAGPGVDPVDDLAPQPPATDPGPFVDPSLGVATAGPCGVHNAIPDDAIYGSDGIYNLNDSDEVRLVTYFDGSVWRLRQQWGTTISEVELPDAGASGARVIGLADVAALGGHEILAIVGGGASTVEVGVFSSFEGPCLFRFQADGGGDFSLFAGATVGSGIGITCGDEWLDSWSYQLEEDDTYTLSGAAFEEVSTGTFGYMLASDGFVEGLTEAELPESIFDCNGLSL